MIQERIELGPIHAALPYAMKLNLGMRGDRIVEAECQFGFLHRGIEESIKGQNYKLAQLRFGRVDPESSIILDQVFSSAIENIFEIEPSERAKWIRKIATVLCELSGNLRYLAKMADRMGLRFLDNIILKHREALLDLVELLTGSRYGYYYILPGGARYELTEGFQERVENWANAFQKDFDRIEAIFRWTHPVQNRLQSMGRVIDLGSFGFVSEASVETIKFGLVSHVESRLLYALSACDELATQLLGFMSEKQEGKFLVALPDQIKNPQAIARFESGRGIWGAEVELNRDFTLKTVEVLTPSECIRGAILPALEDESIEDLPLILQSLNFSVPEIDR